MDDYNGVGNVESCGFLNFKSLYNILKRVEQCFVHTFLVADSCDFGEEESGNRGQIEREPIGHEANYYWSMLKRIPIFQ